MPKRRRVSCPVAVGTFKKNPASMLARRDVPDTGQHIQLALIPTAFAIRT
jgi:hypothetical protein